jgi:hypothetical protein
MPLPCLTGEGAVLNDRSVIPVYFTRLISTTVASGSRSESPWGEYGTGRPTARAYTPLTTATDELADDASVATAALFDDAAKRKFDCVLFRGFGPNAQGKRPESGEPVRSPLGWPGTG